MSLGFSKKLLDALICQRDSASLQVFSVQNENNDVIFSGKLKCPQCARIYSVDGGILNCLSEQSEMEALMKDEVIARDQEATAYDKRLSTRYYKEIPSTLSSLGDLAGKKILEYGCGTGRLTIEMAPKARAILATDFSLKSLQILAKKLDNYKNIGLVLSDAVQFKTKEKYFDLVTSFQFLEHVPSQKQRVVWLGLAQNSLKVGGKFVSTVYHYDWRKKRVKQSQDGKHGSGIFFHYFDQKEFSDYISQYFKVKDIHPIDITLPLESRLSLPAKFSGKISIFFERIPAVNKLGHLLIVKAIKK